MTLWNGGSVKNVIPGILAIWGPLSCKILQIGPLLKIGVWCHSDPENEKLMDAYDIVKWFLGIHD